MARIGFVACSKTKSECRLPAAALYTSALFRKSLLAAIDRSEKVYILSAKHGLLGCGDIVDPYDVTLKAMKRAERAAWGEETGKQLDAVLRPRDAALLFCGEEYLAPLRSLACPMRRIRTYLAAPLFNPRERAFNASLADTLGLCCDVFLPQRDGLLLADLLADGVPKGVAETRIFERDRLALSECEVLIAVLDGAHIDEGVAFEIGFAHGRGCLCLGLQTDVRRALPSGNNPMIGRALSSVFDSVEALVAYMPGELAVLKRHATVSGSAAR